MIVLFIVSAIWLIISITTMSTLEEKREKGIDVTTKSYVTCLTNVLAAFFSFGLSMTIIISLAVKNLN